MKIFLQVILYCVLLDAVRAQAFADITNSPYLEGIACTPRSPSAFGVAANPATLPFINGLCAGFCLENRFLISGLHLAALTAGMTIHGSGIGISARYFGNPSYHELHASMHYARTLGDIQLAASFHYNRYSIGGYARALHWHMGLHSVWKLSDNLMSSVQLIDPPFARLHGETALFAASYHFGLCYTPDEALCVAADLNKTEGAPLRMQAFLNYRLNRHYSLKAGWSTAGPQPFFGLGGQWKDLRIEFALSYHPTLGLSPGWLFDYQRVANPFAP